MNEAANGRAATLQFKKEDQCPGKEQRNDAYGGEVATAERAKVKMGISDAHGRCDKSRVCLWEKTSMLELHISQSNRQLTMHTK